MWRGHCRTFQYKDIDSIPDYWAPLRNGMLLKIGDVDSDEEFNKKISPLYHVDIK